MKYSSRKFIVTMTGILGSFVMAYLGKMTPDVAIVVGAGIGAYNWASAKVSNANV